MFCLKQLRNGSLTGMKAMPQKDLSSDNDSSFAMVLCTIEDFKWHRMCLKVVCHLLM